MCDAKHPGTSAPHCGAVCPIRSEPPSLIRETRDVWALVPTLGRTDHGAAAEQLGHSQHPLSKLMRGAAHALANNIQMPQWFLLPRSEPTSVVARGHVGGWRRFPRDSEALRLVRFTVNLPVGKKSHYAPHPSCRWWWAA